MLHRCGLNDYAPNNTANYQSTIVKVEREKCRSLPLLGILASTKVSTPYDHQQNQAGPINADGLKHPHQPATTEDYATNTAANYQSRKREKIRGKPSSKILACAKYQATLANQVGETPTELSLATNPNKSLQ